MAASFKFKFSSFFPALIPVALPRLETLKGNFSSKGKMVKFSGKNVVRALFMQECFGVV
jgi:hypothetical protein